MTAAESEFIGEPSLATLISDPIADAVRTADRLTEAEVWAAIEAARARLRGAPEPGPVAA
jgi:hypothetical protein